MPPRTRLGDARTRWLWGAVFFLLIVAFLLWPAILNRSPLLFFDSIAYLEQGAQSLRLVSRHLAPGAGGWAHGASPTARPAANFLRSVGYPTFVYVLSLTPLREFGPITVQTAVVLGLVYLLSRSPIRGARSLVAVVAPSAMLSTLPWFCSYLMPDILTAAIILAGMILVRDWEDIGWAGSVFIALSSVLACLSHYGHIPLQLGVGVTAVVLLAAQRRLHLPVATAAIAPVLIAVGMNLAVSSVTLDAPSIAPKRLPNLLARSIEDGPALWHLQRRCGAYHYTICKLYDRIPDNVTALLWERQTSLPARATPQQMDQIRAEEPVILFRAFLDYPVQQAWSLSRNAMLQFVTIGLDDFNWAAVQKDAHGAYVPLVAMKLDRSGLDLIGRVQAGFVLASAGLIAFYVRRDGLRAAPREREMFFVLVVGLMLNAAIFGGLSAPVGRYQGRLIWLVPLFATLCFLNRRPPRVRSKERLDARLRVPV